MVRRGRERGNGAIRRERDGGEEVKKIGKESKSREKKVRTEEEKKIERTFHHPSSVLHTMSSSRTNTPIQSPRWTIRIAVSHPIPFSASSLVKEMDIDPTA